MQDLCFIPEISLCVGASPHNMNISEEIAATVSILIDFSIQKKTEWITHEMPARDALEFT